MFTMKKLKLIYQDAGRISQASGASQHSFVVGSFKKCLSEVNSTFGKSKKQTEFLLKKWT